VTHEADEVKEEGRRRIKERQEENKVKSIDRSVVTDSTRQTEDKGVNPENSCLMHRYIEVDLSVHFSLSLIKHSL